MLLCSVRASRMAERLTGVYTLDVPSWLTLKSPMHRFLNDVYSQRQPCSLLFYWTAEHELPCACAAVQYFPYFFRDSSGTTMHLPALEIAMQPRQVICAPSTICGEHMGLFRRLSLPALHADSGNMPQSVKYCSSGTTAAQLVSDVV